jgi:carbon-monoxide dehydrogenase medium subunit
MIPFEYVEPTSIQETIDVLTRHGDEAKVIAGGTGLINLMKQRLVQPSYVVGLRKVRELEGIKHEGSLRIGALSTHRVVETSSLVGQIAPLLQEALHHVATIRVRNIATIGGALAHADPNQDIPPALIALGATVRSRSPKGPREMPVEHFFKGYYETVLWPDELVSEVIVPEQPADSGAAFLKFLPRTQDDYATVAVAARVRLEDGHIRDARIALGAAGPTPIKATNVENALRGQEPTTSVFKDAAALVADVVDPISDVRGSAKYKRDMAVVFVRRALEQAAARAKGTS